jgi:hypothetical protein
LVFSILSGQVIINIANFEKIVKKNCPSDAPRGREDIPWLFQLLSIALRKTEPATINIMMNPAPKNGATITTSRADSLGSLSPVSFSAVLNSCHIILPMASPSFSGFPFRPPNKRIFISALSTSF